jgi:uncharacterized protein YbaR (Trm112 family)
MEPFICPTCGSKTWKLVAQRDQSERSKDKLACPQCFDSVRGRPSYLHQTMEGAQSRGLTEAKSRIISNRIVCPDDKRIIIDKRTGRETQY